MKANELERIICLLGLIREAQALRYDIEASRRFFLRGMRGLLEADAASWAERGVPEVCDGTVPAPRSTSLGFGMGSHRLSFHRAQPFSPSARELMRLVVEHSWLLERLLVPSVPQRLPRRLRQTLELLLAGRSEKQLADALSLSSHTVHDYVKQLYRRLGVSSRSELFAHTLSPSAGTISTAVSFEGAS